MKSVTAILLAAWCICFVPAQATNQESIVNGMSEFGWNLYQKVAEGNNNNIFLSPLSLHTVLTMVYTGAGEDTKTQMAEVLNLDDLSDSDVDTAYSALLSVLDPDDSDAAETELAIANKVYASDSFSFIDEFISNLEDSYQSDLEEVGFASDPESARDTINTWVSDQTNDRIPEVLGDGTVNSDTVLVIVNAIYFLATWETQFAEALTAPGDFTVADGDVRQVDMMTTTGMFVVKTVSAFDDAQLLELPYVDEETSFFILLPSEQSDLASLEESFTLEAIQTAVSTEQSALNYQIQLPKFEMQQELNLRSLLMGMGMTDAFTAGQADFTGMSQDAQLYITDVVQKTFIKVNENGTEAAAVSTATISVVSLPQSFHVNRPFMFFILHKPTGTVLFMGRYVSPPSSSEPIVVGSFYQGPDDTIDGGTDGATSNMVTSVMLVILAITHIIM